MCICAHQFALLPAAWASFAVELPQEKLSRNHTRATCHIISTLGNKIWMATTETKQFFVHLIHGNRPNLQKDYTTPAPLCAELLGNAAAAGRGQPKAMSTSLLLSAHFPPFSEPQWGRQHSPRVLFFHCLFTHTSFVPPCSFPSSYKLYRKHDLGYLH